MTGAIWEQLINEFEVRREQEIEQKAQQEAEKENLPAHFPPQIPGMYGQYEGEVHREIDGIPVTETHYRFSVHEPGKC